MKLIPVLLLSLSSAPAAAQLRGVPARTTAALEPGFTLSADYGRELRSPAALAQHLGGGASLRLGRAAFQLSGGLWDAGSAAQAQVGARGGLTVWGGAESPLRVVLEGGAGYFWAANEATSSTHLAFPLGLGLATRPFNLNGRALRPWIAPRVEANQVTFSGIKLSQFGYGASFGFSVDLFGSFALRTSGEWVRFRDRQGEGVMVLGGSRVVIGAGLDARFQNTARRQP